MAHTNHRRKTNKAMQPTAYKRKTRAIWQREYDIVAA